MGSKRDSDDNALAETIYGLIQGRSDSSPLLAHRRIGGVGNAEVGGSWFNHHELIGPIGYISPAEADANDDQHLPSQTSTKQPGLNHPAFMNPGTIQFPVQ